MVFQSGEECEKGMKSVDPYQPTVLGTISTSHDNGT